METSTAEAEAEAKEAKAVVVLQHPRLVLTGTHLVYGIQVVVNQIWTFRVPQCMVKVISVISVVYIHQLVNVVMLFVKQVTATMAKNVAVGKVMKVGVIPVVTTKLVQRLAVQAVMVV